MVQGGAVQVNKETLGGAVRLINTADLLNGKYLLAQRGKKNYFLLMAK